MRVGLVVSNAALAEYFVDALGLAGHSVTLSPSREDLFTALFTDVSLRQRAPYDLLLVELILDDDGKQVIAELYRLARDQKLPFIVLTTSSQEAITQAQAAFPWLCIRQLPLRLRALLTLIQAQEPSTLSAALPFDQ
jgi:DNA-binding response OmpR family regulator